MRNFYSFLIIMIFFISCTNEIDLPKTSTFSSNERSVLEMPANSDNPYDEAGRLHTELFEAYYASDTLPTTIPDIAGRVELLASNNSELSGLITIGYDAISADRIQYILSHTNISVTEIIDATGMTTEAKLSLGNFINTLSLLFEKEESGEVLYNFVADYEAVVLNDSLLTENDKRIILTTSSIVRYSSYRVLKRPKKSTDPDWILMTSHIIAATDGARYGAAEAITRALATGIAENQ